MSADQEEALISYMEGHSGLAQNKYMGINGVLQSQEQWLQLSLQLNELGPTKDVKSWKQCWTHFKSDARHYNARNSKVFRKTGNETDNVPEYNIKFERILNIMGRHHMNGLELIPEVCGTPLPLSNLSCVSKKHKIEQVASCSSNNVVRQPKYDPNEMTALLNSVQNLAKKFTHSDIHKRQFQAEVLSLLTNIKERLTKILN